MRSPRLLALTVLAALAISACTGYAAAPTLSPTSAPTAALLPPALADGPAAAPTASPMASPSTTPSSTPIPATAVKLTWACAGDGWGESAAPVMCQALPPCYFAAACQLEDQAWFQPSELRGANLKAACADIARTHHRTVSACLRDIKSWDQKQGWGVDDYIYADPDAPLYSAPGSSPTK